MNIEQAITEELTVELKNSPDFNAEILELKVKNAVREVKLRRNYTATSFDDKKIDSDLYNYYSTILNVARYDYNQIGAEGEQSHSENGISRSYIDRDALFRGVHPFVKVLV